MPHAFMLDIRVAGPNSKDMDRTEIVIVGGGLIGPAIALALHGAGFDVVLVDAKPLETRRDPEFDGRAYAVSLASQRLLGQLGVWQQVEPHAQLIADIHVAEGTAPEPLLHFDPRELDESRFGWDHRGPLAAPRAAGYARGREHSATGRVRDRDSRVFPGNRAEVGIAEGQSLSAPLVIAADGRRSAMARRAGIRRLGWSYSQNGLVNAIEHELPHHGVAHQSFFPGGPFAVLPLQGNRSSLVWSEQSREAGRLAALPDETFIAEVSRRVAGRLGEIRLIGRRWSYPLDLSLADRFVSSRLALIGDAAHGVHPIAGQGMNLGLRDVAALAEVLTDAARRGEDLGGLQVLERYQRWRRFDTTLMALGMDGLNRLFSNDIGPIRALRTTGMRAVGQLGGLRRAFMRQAIGAEGDVPRLLKGLPL